MDDLAKIGTVELLRARIYPLDAETSAELCHCPHLTVIVAPGVFDLYSDGLAFWWVMRGQLNQRGAWRMGDGMFAVWPSDRPSGIDVVFPSKRFGHDEWAKLLTEPELTEGHEHQRLRVSLAVRASKPYV